MYHMIDPKLKADRPADAPEPQTEPRRSLRRRVWNHWLKFAEIVGTIQMVIILTLLYWTVLALTAIPFRVFADPLGLKRPQGWVQCGEEGSDLDSMKNQY